MCFEERSRSVEYSRSFESSAFVMKVNPPGTPANVPCANADVKKQKIATVITAQKVSSFFNQVVMRFSFYQPVVQVIKYAPNMNARTPVIKPTMPVTIMQTSRCQKSCGERHSHSTVGGPRKI